MHFPKNITLETNPDDCNLNCIICDTHSPLNKSENRKQEQMPEQLLIKILKEAVENGVKQITPSTMGEPLVYKHFDLLHQYCKAGNVKMNITTNGTFPGQKTEKWAQMLCEVCSDIKVSMLGTDDTTLKENMAGVKYDFLVSNIKKLVATRNNHFQKYKQYVTVTLKLTFMKNILHNLEELIETAREIGVDRVRGHFLLSLYDEVKKQDIKSDKNAIKEWNELVERLKHKMKGAMTLSGRGFILDNFDPITESEESSKKTCPYLGNELVLKADGDVVSCCVPDILRNTIPIFGNLNKQTIKEIWKGEVYQSFCRNYLQYEVCRECELRI